MECMVMVVEHERIFLKSDVFRERVMYWNWKLERSREREQIGCNIYDYMLCGMVAIVCLLCNLFWTGSLSLG